ncbi:MAG TPA: xanthine dehydrogenase family protein subunit M [Candidatus Nanopelagicaceae bacterium]|nr:xanthine dehydrogenase family protein subunit M [Candidatus Nanopelagicaceae bacterium]
MTFLTARSTEQAVSELALRGDELLVLAGGTDVMVQYQRREIQHSSWLQIRRIKELQRIDIATGDRLNIGALTSHRVISLDPLVARWAPALATACSTVGGWQTQEAGTIGGNICNASPAADLAPPLLAADATVTLMSSRGSRTMPLSEFILGRRSTARQPDELATALELKPLPDRAGEVYLKLGPRRAMEVALVGLAVRLMFDDDGVVIDARVAVGSVAPAPFRSQEAERALIGSRFNDVAAIEAAAAALTADAAPIDDARAPAVYRRRVLSPLLARAIAQCQNQTIRN